MQAKPDNEDCNMKFLKALPPSWSQVAITLKTKGGLDNLSFDDLYNKLMTLEIDVKGGSSYDSRGTSAPTHSAFIWEDGLGGTDFKLANGNMWKLVVCLVYGMMLDAEEDVADSDTLCVMLLVQTCPFGCEHLYAELKKEFDNVEVQYKECYIQAKFEKLDYMAKLEESKARFDKWKDSSKNLDKLIHSSMSSRLKFGLGFGDTFGSDEGMHIVPPPYNRELSCLLPTFRTIDVTRLPMVSKSNNYVDTNSVYNDFVSCDNSDKSSDSETTDFASCVSSVKSSSSKTNEPLASTPSSVDFKFNDRDCCSTNQVTYDVAGIVKHLFWSVVGIDHHPVPTGEDGELLSKPSAGRKAHLLEDKQIPSVGVFDEVFLALGWHLEEIHVTWAHLEKKRTRLRTYTKSLEESCLQRVETASQA
ncbi:hypothetical protein Tco_1507098 [Tanacetum coccineum]